MATPQINWREPQNVAAGDTLLFQRNIPDYLPTDGWKIRLTVTLPIDGGGGTEITQVVSVPDSSNQFHTFNVPNFCAGAVTGGYILSEELFNAGTGEKHQIYFDDAFIIGPPLDSGVVPAIDEIKTEAQEMLETIIGTLKELYSRKFKETDVQRNRFITQEIKDMLDQYKFWTAKRQNEIQLDNIRNGRRPGNTQEAVFAIG